MAAVFGGVVAAVESFWTAIKAPMWVAQAVAVALPILKEYGGLLMETVAANELASPPLTNMQKRLNLENAFLAEVQKDIASNAIALDLFNKIVTVTTADDGTKQYSFTAIANFSIECAVVVKYVKSLIDKLKAANITKKV